MSTDSGNRAAPASAPTGSRGSRAATPAKKFAVGSTVRVQLGASMHNATVLGHRNGRVQVAVHFTEVEEPVTTSYRPDELSAA